MLTHAEIAARLPHSGAMCLLDRVEQWDDEHIVCLAAPPGADHPLALARAGPPQAGDSPLGGDAAGVGGARPVRGVPVVAAAEYAAQAAALHGSLQGGRREPRHGLLATLSGVKLSAGWLDADSGALTIRADLLARGDAGCSYAFAVHDARGCRARGRLLVAFTDAA